MTKTNSTLTLAQIRECKRQLEAAPHMTPEEILTQLLIGYKWTFWLTYSSEGKHDERH